MAQLVSNSDRFQNGTDLLICPYCNKEQDDSVEHHCVKGHHMKSQSVCVHCNGWFTVLWNGSKFGIKRGKLS